MNRIQIVDRIIEKRIVAIVRMNKSDHISQAVKAVVDGGIDILEITSTSPDYLDIISRSRQLHPDALIGAGTVTNRFLAIKAVSAGAQFLVSPNTSREVVEVAHKHGLPVLLGALTPTEIAHAIDYEADFIKIFPSDLFGPQYLKSLRGPYPTARLFAVGGVNHQNLMQWIANGATGVGIGSNLVPHQIGSSADLEAIKTKCKLFTESLNAK